MSRSNGSAHLAPKNPGSRAGINLRFQTNREVRESLFNIKTQSTEKVAKHSSMCGGGHSILKRWDFSRIRMTNGDSK